MKDIYIAVYKDDEKLMVFKFKNHDTIGTNFFNTVIDNGYTIKNITEEEYNSCNIGDELTIDDIKNGNYTIEE